MIISEKQIMQLMNIAISYYAFLELVGSKKEKQEEILKILGDIEQQQPYKK